MCYICNKYELTGVSLRVDVTLPCDSCQTTGLAGASGAVAGRCRLKPCKPWTAPYIGPPPARDGSGRPPRPRPPLAPGNAHFGSELAISASPGCCCKLLPLDTLAIGGKTGLTITVYSFKNGYYLSIGMTREGELTAGIPRLRWANGCVVGKKM